MLPAHAYEVGKGTAGAISVQSTKPVPTIEKHLHYRECRGVSGIKIDDAHPVLDEQSSLLFIIHHPLILGKDQPSVFAHNRNPIPILGPATHDLMVAI